jgi:hypothetical protein
MRRFMTISALVALAVVGVVGCAQFRREQRAEWRGEAERACLRTGKVRETAHVKIGSRALEGPGMCGADHPVRVTAFSMDALFTASSPGLSSGAFLTKLNQPATFTCPMTAAMDDWLEKVVQPSAMARFGQPVAEVSSMGTYACRSMNNQRGARLSEHAFANAIDIGGFKLADGRSIRLSKDWKGGDVETQFFLREVHAGACRFFSTVLGPGYNALHYDHFHFDLARHGRNGKVSICRPNPETIPAPMERFPIDPGARPGETPVARAPLPGTAVAVAPVQPRAQTPLPESRALTYARSLSREPRPPADFSAVPRGSASPRGPMVLYGQGQGPFTPARDDEIDEADMDAYTGSVGE